MTNDWDDSATTGGAATPPDDAPPSAEPNDVAALHSLLEDERAKAQAYMQNWQRAAADHQNYKRRVEDDRSEFARAANIAVVINLLPLMDDLDRALQNVDPQLAGLTWLEGIRLIQRKLRGLIEMLGVSEIDADGQTFDPAEHEAVTQAPGEENKVIAVIEKGYRLGDRLVRPAKVVVGNGT